MEKKKIIMFRVKRKKAWWIILWSSKNAIVLRKNAYSCIRQRYESKIVLQYLMTITDNKKKLENICYYFKEKVMTHNEDWNYLEIVGKYSILINERRL